MKVIPAMDLLGGRVVRLRRGSYDDVTVYSDDPDGVLASFVAAGARWVHVVDLDGARDGRATQAGLLERLLKRYGLRARVQVGGGIRTIEQVCAYADAGAERVVLGTQAVRDLEFVRRAGSFCGVVVAIDARGDRVATDGWTVQTELRVTEFAVACAEAGARALLYTDIDRDGTREGPAVEATAALARAVPGVPVIASGGVGRIDDVRALAARPEIAAVVVGRALYERSFGLAEAIRAAEEGAGPGAGEE